MKIKKLDEEITYQKKCETLTFEINGKEVRVYSWYIDGELEGYDSDYEVDEDDKKELTEEEWDLFNDNLLDLMSSETKVGEELEVE